MTLCAFHHRRFAAALALAVPSALAPVALGQIAVNAPDDKRIVAGQSDSLTFGLTNDYGTFVEFDATRSPGGNIDFTPGGGSLVSGNPTVTTGLGTGLSGNAVFGTGVLTGAAGSTQTFTLNIDDDQNGFGPAGSPDVDSTGSTTYTLLNNRTFTGTADFGNQGRHMIGQAIGTVTINDVSGLGANKGTLTTLNANTNGSAYSNGTRFRSASGSDTTFDGTTTSATLNVTREESGSYTGSFALTAATLDPSGTLAQVSGSGFYSGQPLLYTEQVKGAGINATGVSVTASGTAVADRGLDSDAYNFRVMQNGPVTSVNLTGGLVFVGTEGSDNEYTRLNLADFSHTNADGGTIALDTGGAGSAFNSGTSTASVNLSGTVTLDKSTLGLKDRRFQAAGHLTGEGLAGEDVQDDLRLGYTYNVVQDNVITAGNVNIYRLGNSSIHGVTFFNPNIVTQSTETHTDINVTTTFHGTGTKTLSEGAGTVTREGLDGETPDSATYNVSLATIDRASFTHSPLGTPLEDGDVLTIANAAGGQRVNGDVHLNLGGGRWDLFRVDSLGFGGGGFPRSFQNYNLDPGESVNVGTVNFYDPNEGGGGGFGTVYRAYLNGTLSDGYFAGVLNDAAVQFVNGGIIVGDSRSKTVTWTLEHVDGVTANTASDHFDDQFDFEQRNAQLRSTAGTTAEIIDSLELGRDVTVTATFQDRSTATGAGAGGLIGNDILSLTGLGEGALNAGILHVLQLSYNPAQAAGGGGAVTWFNPNPDDEALTDDGAWMNAVLGNSNIELDLIAETVTVGGSTLTIDEYLDTNMFVGSYGSYLASLNPSGAANPELGAWGIDVSRNRAWAVIDHNSLFGVTDFIIPEPGTLVLLGLGTLNLLGRRRAVGV